jgi:hypothetical protein
MLSKLKYPQLWKGEIGAAADDVDGYWQAWLLIARLYDLQVITDEFDVVTLDGEPRSDPRRMVKFKREIIERMKQRRGIDDLLLKGWITKLYQDGQKPTTSALIKRLGMNRGTFYQKFRPAMVEKIRHEIGRSFSLDEPTAQVGADPEIRI